MPYKSAEDRRKNREKNKEHINALVRAKYYENLENSRLRQREYRLDNKEKINAAERLYRTTHREQLALKDKRKSIKHKEEIAARKRQYQQDHKEEIAARKHLYYLKNRDSILAKHRERRYSKTQRVPEWADRKAIARVYRDCPEGYEVDHIVPLHGKNVSGLHVEYNLQYLTKLENLRKSNNFPYGDYK